MSEDDAPSIPVEGAAAETPTRTEADDGGLFERRTADQRTGRGVDTWSAVLLAVTVIFTAWSGFQASKWGGAMSIAFSQASTARLEANRAAALAESSRQADLSIYAVWVQAKAAGEEKEAAYVQDRFTAWFRPAFDEWVSLGGISDPQHAPKSPFALKSYVPPGTSDVAASDARADAKYTQALANNQRGDNYTVLGVLFATVLFFAAMATRFAERRLQYGLLGFATVAFCFGLIMLLSFPKLV